MTIGIENRQVLVSLYRMPRYRDIAHSSRSYSVVTTAVSRLGLFFWSTLMNCGAQIEEAPERLRVKAEESNLAVKLLVQYAHIVKRKISASLSLFGHHNFGCGGRTSCSKKPWTILGGVCFVYSRVVIKVEHFKAVALIFLREVEQCCAVNGKALLNLQARSSLALDRRTAPCTTSTTCPAWTWTGRMGRVGPTAKYLSCFVDAQFIS